MPSANDESIGMNCTPQVQVETIQSIYCEHSTSPIWDETNEVFYFIDVSGNAIHRYHPDSGAREQLRVSRDVKVSFVALTEVNNELLVGCGNTVMKLYIDGNNKLSFGETTSYIRLDMGVDLTQKRIAMGKCSPYGELFFVVEPSDRNSRVKSAEDIGNILYRTVPPKEKAGSKMQQYMLQEVISPAKAPGRPAGLCWDHGGRSLYVTDSTTRKLLRYVSVPFRSTLENREDVFDFSELGEGIPAGVAVDKKGFVWVAMDGTGEVVCIDPTKGFGKGEVAYKVKMPVKHITSCAFGGPNLEDLFVTSRITGNLSSSSKASVNGSLFRVKLPGVSGAAGTYLWKPFTTAGRYTTTLGVIMVGVALSVFSAAEIARQNRDIPFSRGGGGTNL